MLPNYLPPQHSVTPHLLLTGMLFCGLSACQGGSTNQDGEMLSYPGCDIGLFSCQPNNLCQEKVCEGVGWTCVKDPTKNTYLWSLTPTCDDGDPCTQGDVCQSGVCQGEPIKCPATSDPCQFMNVCQEGTCHSLPLNCSNLPHSTAGFCEQGKCKLTCDNGYGDCDNLAENGCERRLDTSENCNRCDNPCPTYDHTTVRCERGNGNTPTQCVWTCQAPYDNCDGNWLNGCEIPVGIPNTCNQHGLVKATTSDQIPCGTAYCGRASEAYFDVINHGTFFCKMCSNCHFFSEKNTYSWCDWGTGNFKTGDNYTYCDPSFIDQVCPRPTP